MFKLCETIKVHRSILKCELVRYTPQSIFTAQTANE